MERVRISNKKIFPFKSREEFLNHIEGKKAILIALNAEKLNRADETLDSIINENIGYPDGVGAVWALKRKGIDSVKIAGAEFWLDIIAKFKDFKSFYFIGSTQEVIDKTIAKLKTEFGEFEIKGFRDGFLKKGDKEKLIKDFRKQKPDIVFIAMGSPKQELLMSELMDEHPALYMGLGGSFDVYVGHKRRAPKLFQKLGLEWFYRLLKEPTRWKRQLTYISFSLKVIFNRI